MANPPTRPLTPEKLAAQEAEILDPDITIHLSDGRAVTVREIRRGQANRLGADLRPFVDGIAKRSVKGTLDVRAIIQLPEDHPEMFARVLEASTGLSIAEQETLRDEDGEMLEAVFWRVNLGFFARRVARALPENLADLAKFVGEDVGLPEAVAAVVRGALSTLGSSSNSSPSTATTPSG